MVKKWLISFLSNNIKLILLLRQNMKKINLIIVLMIFLISCSKAQQNNLLEPLNKTVQSKQDVKNNKENSLLLINSHNIQSKLKTIMSHAPFLNDYKCGEDNVKGLYLGEIYRFQLYLIENVCGDFDFRDLVITQNGKLVSKLLVDIDYWDIEKQELHNITD